LIDLALIPRDASMLAVIVGTLLLLGLLSLITRITADYAKAKLGTS
jgi:hypothetical protein